MGFTDQALSLNLGLSSSTGTTTRSTSAATHRASSRRSAEEFEPSLTLSLCGGGVEQQHKPSGGSVSAATAGQGYYYNNNSCQYSSPRSCSGVSSVSGVKRERDSEEAADDRSGGSDEEEEEETMATHSNSSQTNTGVRKKLRLSKDQSAMLEDSFKQHSTLNPKQKQALANQLNLRPRQVEVWFQNRRARTKLKQTEVDCEFLKKCCETLTEENRRLQKEVQELRAIKQLQLQSAARRPQQPAEGPSPMYIHHAAATLTMCPSCERVCRNSNSNNDSSSVPAALGFTKTKSQSQQQQHFVYAFAAAAAAGAGVAALNPSAC